MSSGAEPRRMWRPTPDAVVRTAMSAFQRTVEAEHGRRFADWPALHRWSVDEYQAFWRLFLRWSEVRFSGNAEPVCTSDEIETARFFPNVSLSFVSHLLDGAGAADEAIAVVEGREEPAQEPRTREVSRRELRARVAQYAHAFRAAGVRPGDRVVGLVTHDAETISAVLGAVGIGATWAACGPELAHDAIVARLAQLDPVLLIVSSGGTTGGQAHQLVARARALATALPTVRTTMILGDTDAASLADWPHPVYRAADALASVPASMPVWPEFAFDHPLYVLFSSGTTGAPKAIVHGAGGTLLTHLKEHRLHGDLGPDDRLYFQTSCGWMMWHWTVSALATGAAVVTYDGAVGYPDARALWHLARRAGVTVLGASPTYWQFCRESGVRPRAVLSETTAGADPQAPRAPGASRLRALLSTGSRLDAEWYDWVQEAVGDVPLQSISGGSDIIGCFVLGNPMLPVYRGESQCLALGMDVRAHVDPAGGPAILACGRPFPSRPVGFLHDPDGRRFHETYFAELPGLWSHGDFVEISARGTARILGRADAVLKVKGIRIGPVEVTAPVIRLPEIREAMAVEQRHAASPGGTRIVLLVVLEDGITLDRPLTHRIKRAVRDAASADHVPAVVAAVPGLPVTVNGKPSERAAREALHGQVPANRSALRNPEVLDAIRALPDASSP